MIVRASASLFVGLAACAVLPTLAVAAKLPPIVVSKNNTVPACVTPGRLMAYLKDRNKRLSPRFSSISTEYMRHGEDLGIRWDIAFFQMIVETGSLTYRGDVKPKQNNFAGLGATGRGARGETFQTVGLGARAHMQHTLMYSGKYVENPVADRTRKVQEWKVLDKWRKRLPKPVTFTHLTRKWSPTDRGYSNDIKAVADKFYNDFCDRPDPQPELVAIARGGKTTKTAAIQTKQPTSGQKLAAAAIERGRENGTERSSLGGASLAEGLSKSYSNGSRKTAPSYKVINNSASKGSNGPATTPTLPSNNERGAFKTAAVTSPGAAAAVAKPGKCRVWTASYGGGKAVIIKAASNDGMTNFTVLDVNKDREDREANAYISAYAKGGAAIAKFDTQDAALDKAFELCPEK